MNEDSVGDGLFFHIIHSWHEWAYYAIVVAFVLLWVFFKLRDLWHVPTAPVSEALAKRAQVKEHVLWSLLVGAFLLSAVHSESSLQRIDKSVRSINSHLAEVDSERLETARNRLDSAFNLIFGDRLDSAISHLRTAVSNKEIVLGYDEFKSLYIETLAKLPNHTFLAMAIPSKKYFWGDSTVKDAIARFMSSGGHMRRIFILDDPLTKDSEAYEIMSAQHAMKIDVYYALRSEIPPEKQSLGLVDDELVFSWTLDVDSTGRIAKATGTSNIERSRALASNWKYVLQHYAKQFDPSLK